MTFTCRLYRTLAGLLTFMVAMQTGAIAVLNASRIPQIASNWRNGGSGELSMTSVTLNTLGSVARVFTNLVLTGDPLLLGNSTLGLFLNGIIFVQCLRTQLRDRATREAKAASSPAPAPALAASDKREKNESWNSSPAPAAHRGVSSVHRKDGGRHGALYTHGADAPIAPAPVPLHAWKRYDL